MVDAVTTYAARMGLSVSVAVLDREGGVLTSTGVDVDAATRKAYTALMYGVATHELRAANKPLWRQASDIDATRVLMNPGGFPVVAVESRFSPSH